MKQHIETKLGVTIILIFAMTVGAFIWKWEKEREWNTSENSIVALSKKQQVARNKESSSEISDQKTNSVEESATEKVSFCGKTFETNIVKVNTTDLVKIIAQIATHSPENRICENIIANSPGGKFSSDVKKQKVTDADYKDGVYFANISILQFKIDSIENNLYIIGAFDGKSKLIGKLR